MPLAGAGARDGGVGEGGRQSKKDQEEEVLVVRVAAVQLRVVGHARHSHPRPSLVGNGGASQPHPPGRFPGSGRHDSRSAHTGLPWSKSPWSKSKVSRPGALFRA